MDSEFSACEGLVAIAALENYPDGQAFDPASLSASGDRIDLSALQSSVPPSLFTVLSKLDMDGDGFITVGELEMHVSSVKEGTIVLDALNDQNMKSHMKKFDIDGDGNLKLQEILSAFKLSQDRTEIMKYSLLFLLLALIVSYVTLGGLVYYVVQISKDSSIGTSGVMFVKGTDQLVQVASADFTVKDGVFYSRATGSCSNGTCPSAAPIQTQQALEPLKLSSTLDDATLEQMRHMKLTSGGSFLSFQVLAIARYTEPNSRFGSLVVVYTHVGELTLDGEAIFFHESLAGAFSRAGFVVDSSGRRLLGVIEVIGMFNAISKAAKEALERNPAADVPAALPTEFVARVVFTEACDDKAGRSNGVCELRDGRRVNWVTRDAVDGPVMRREEVQYSLKVGGRRFAKETATSEQWPGQSVTALYNETHRLVYQTYLGVNYHCELSATPSMRVPPPPGDGASVVMVGYKEVAGVYCRHFRMTVPMKDGPAQMVHLYEDYVRRRLLAVRFGNMRWLFANLSAVASEADNPLAPRDLDLDAVLPTCDPPGLVAPPRIIRGLLTARVDHAPDWGNPIPASANNGSSQPNASLPSLQVGGAQARRALERLGDNASAEGDVDSRQSCIRRSKNLVGLSGTFTACSVTTKITLTTIAGPGATCPRTTGQLEVTVDWQRLLAFFSGSVTFQFGLSCVSGLGLSLSSIASSVTMSVTVSAGFQPLYSASGCGNGGFSRGVHYFSGEASFHVGSSMVNFRGSANGRLILGLVCSDSQSAGSSVLAGVSLLVQGQLTVAGNTNFRSFYLEPSSSGVCGQTQRGSFLPNGIGFDAGDGLSYNFIDTGFGQCY